QMDTSKPAAFVNGEFLPMYIGRKVRAVVQNVQPGAGVSRGNTTDDRQLIIKGSPPFQLTTYMEVIGIADNNQSIQAEKWTPFGNSFDASTYNQLCRLANGEHKNLFL
ncbi:Replication factor A protein 3, partial [Dillenia turbinata]